MENSCAFTGHRKVGTDLDINLLYRVVENLILYKNVTKFYCGMAMGFDLIAAECVIKLKERYPKIKLVACVPHVGQENNFPLKEKEKYAKIISRCDEGFTLSQNYYKGCMQYRDRFMVDNSSVLVCFLRENSGGTYYTYKYAKNCGLQIIEV